METAKVDIRKLQLLNDRVNQCIDALNQVRLSAHGLSHTTPGAPGLQSGIGALAGNPAFGLGYQGFGQGQFGGFGQGQFGGFGQGPFGQVPFAQASLPQGFIPGLSHTTGIPGTIPNMFGPMATPLGYPPYNPWAGLSHADPETFEAYGRPAWVDALLAARIAQTFPYVRLPIPPVVTIY